MNTQAYNYLLDLINYGIRLYRRFGLAYTVGDASPPQTINEYLSQMQDPRLVYHLYPVANKLTKTINYSFDFIYERPVSDIFYTVNNYIKSFYGRNSFGKAAKDFLSYHIHNIPTDYQLIHKKLFQIEDDGYYRVLGRYQPTITLSGASTNYTNHNRYTVSFDGQSTSLSPINSYFETNWKYWIEQNDLLFICKTAVPNFYMKTDIVKTDGTEIQDVFWSVQFGTRTISLFTVLGYETPQFIGNVFSNNYKLNNNITPETSIPAGSKICRIKEFHIPNSYTYTSGDFIFCFGIASFFYSGNELYSFDYMYQLPIITS